ncbi:hypothetical protein PGO_094230 [Plasmodium gonderi]|uniref:Uncharacterized protein n=1 Tax=Plasmodium gonderi TaxID=77519 RepID=A0A1Y1JKA2_PLAGO|nr:hypothetical protein PGO_094230 [Plasmodium gonderi]GAW81222.1 hypothetical protein PGO_094230 [Plasmodium gonderi]
MRFLNASILFSILIVTYTFCAIENDPIFCKKTHRGILKYHKKKDEQEYITVSSVLKNDTLDFYRGSTIYDTVDLREVLTPLLIFSTSPECMTINMVNKDSIVLCCNSEECINNWWLFLTKQILCLNMGEMRNENDEKTLENVQHNIINNDNFDGVSINIEQDLEDIPNVRIKAES